MKVVMTGSATDPEHWQDHIRNKAQMRALKARASDPDDPLDVVIVRDMWLTGFDSPAMTTMYVDKPMRGVSLMQAITRVNRTFRDKPAGLIVDYIGIAEDLKTPWATTRSATGQRKVGADIEAPRSPRWKTSTTSCARSCPASIGVRCRGEDRQGVHQRRHGGVEWLLGAGTRRGRLRGLDGDEPGGRSARN
jgi:superfamily II DNA or RNA helicase